MVQTETVLLTPTAGLLAPCPLTVPIPEVVVEDIYINQDAYRKGEETCSIKMDKLIEWYKDNGSSSQ